jgi:hypothetical protein
MRDTEKTDAASDGSVTMGDWLVWGQFLDPNVNQDTIPMDSYDQELSIGVIKIWWFVCEIIR